MPEIYSQFAELAEKLERHYRDMQDLEFTVERGKLWMLQTRNGKRTGPAAVKIAVDMVREGLIDEHTALLRVPAGDLDQLLHKRVDPEGKAQGPDPRYQRQSRCCFGPGSFHAAGSRGMR